MSHKGNQRGKGRPEKARPPIVQHATAPRTVKAIASPPNAPEPPAATPPMAAALPQPSAEPPKPPLPAPAPVVEVLAPPPPPMSTIAEIEAVPHPPNGVRPNTGRLPAGQLGGRPTPPPSAANGHAPSEPKSTKHITQRTATPPGELSEMFETLRALFVRDRTNGARPDAARCGICYLSFAREELTYHEEAGFYACPDCQQALQTHGIAMLRRQRK